MFRNWGSYTSAVWRHWRDLATGSGFAVAALIAGWLGVPLFNWVLALFLFSIAVLRASYKAWNEEHLQVEGLNRDLATAQQELRQANQRAGEWHTKQGLHDWLAYQLAEVETIREEISLLPIAYAALGTPEFIRRSFPQEALDAIAVQVERQLRRFAVDHIEIWRTVINEWYQKVIASGDPESPEWVDALRWLGQRMAEALQELLRVIPRQPNG